jgi:hypothetical protein
MTEQSNNNRLAKRDLIESQAATSTSLESSERRRAASIKCTPCHKKAQAGHKVTKVKEDILSRVIQLEKELGCQPGLLDLLCRFNREEIGLVWDDLLWIYPDLMSKGTTVPELVVA